MTTSPPTALVRGHVTALVTGSNKGLGAETTRRLAALGWTVWMGARDVAAAHATADRIRRDQPDADLRPVALDVTDPASVDAARETVGASGTGLDVLVNNAGVADPSTLVTAATRAEDLLPTYAVNVLGPVRVTEAFLPLLQESPTARVVMVSSGLGDLTHVNDPERAEHGVPGFVYQSSKAALDMIADRYDAALSDVRVRAVDPGYTATDLNGHSGPQTLTEGTDAIVAAASAEAVPAGKFDRTHLSVDLGSGVGAAS
ncbi:SDR family NAD(P)-dependent oxidoreductase [Nocardioides flavescens]|uniref:SDR family NAD(P)-dependent oxidoreductase n=1 Tax=Nocardioides flavescens TaxID=2691959 RepID=A0A6L7F2P1_9ACTN|nr:SDR family NAD(P)-dependent oxidoreductase [Nocardioides flavescens]MXG91352.1 SDR family NAD(P)-dependent oxidoreductase [Nocardioides flavescens]